ncbi:MAG: NADH-quinone oxidoreductase subunit J [Deltaproteobacteria bacterium]
MELRPISSTAEIVAFVIFAAIALMGGLATVIMRNPIRCAVGLFTHIVALAGLYLNLGAQFLGVVQMLVYAGAVVVLFVFVIMLLGPAADTPKDARGTVPRGIGVLAAAAVGAIVLATTLGYMKRFMPVRPDGYGTLKVLGEYLFTTAALPFELVGVTLVTAVVGAFAVARGRHQKRDQQPEDGTPTDGPKSASSASEAHT